MKKWYHVAGEKPKSGDEKYGDYKSTAVHAESFNEAFEKYMVKYPEYVVSSISLEGDVIE